MQVIMDAYVTFRFPALAVSGGEGKSLAASSEQVNTETAASDEALLAQVCDGSREALGMLFRRYAHLVHTISNRILRDCSEADDLLQDIFLFIYRKSGSFDSSKSSGRSWIVQMTYHRAIDRRRQLQTRHFYAQVDLNRAMEVLDPYSESGENTEFLRSLVGNTTIQGLLDTLSEDQRNTLSLHFYEGYTFAEIAVKLDQSLGNVRNHYYRGLEKLRRQMFRAKLSGRNGYGRK
jgi:RNA polymerase sigma-70 factor, ECF subfamily